MLSTTDKFKILFRDEFTCQYCGSNPGSEGLEVDHLIPKSKFGSDNPENLVSACKKCNRGKSGNIYFPKSLILRKDFDENWFVHKSFGAWSIKFCTENAVVESNWGYWIHIDRVYEKWWPNQISEKEWERAFVDHHMCDFLDCLDYAKRLVDCRAIYGDREIPW